MPSNKYIYIHILPHNFHHHQQQITNIHAEKKKKRKACKGNMYVHVYIEIITSEGFFVLTCLYLSVAFLQKALTGEFLSLITMV